MNGSQVDLSMPAPIADRFKLAKKWFWIGIVTAFFHIGAGLIYGIALVVEKDHRKEGLIIILWAIIWGLVSFFWVGPWLVKSGLLTKFPILK